jgi:hypothetical protein
MPFLSMQLNIVIYGSGTFKNFGGSTLDSLAHYSCPARHFQKTFPSKRLLHKFFYPDFDNSPLPKRF